MSTYINKGVSYFYRCFVLLFIRLQPSELQPKHDFVVSLSNRHRFMKLYYDGRIINASDTLYLTSPNRVFFHGGRFKCRLKCVLSSN